MLNSIRVDIVPCSTSSACSHSASPTLFTLQELVAEVMADLDLGCSSDCGDSGAEQSTAT